MSPDLEFRCECNNRVYKSQKTLDIHKKTTLHFKNMNLKGGNNLQMTPVYSCECSEKTFNTKGSYTQHCKSMKHRNWKMKRELKELKEDLTRKEIELSRKNRKIEELEDANLTLLKEMSFMRETSNTLNTLKLSQILKNID